MHNTGYGKPTYSIPHVLSANGVRLVCEMAFFGPPGARFFAFAALCLFGPPTFRFLPVIDYFVLFPNRFEGTVVRPNKTLESPDEYIITGEVFTLHAGGIYFVYLADIDNRYCYIKFVYSNELPR